MEIFVLYTTCDVECCDVELCGVLVSVGTNLSLANVIFINIYCVWYTAIFSVCVLPKCNAYIHHTSWPSVVSAATTLQKRKPQGNSPPVILTEWGAHSNLSNCKAMIFVFIYKLCFVINMFNAYHSKHVVIIYFVFGQLHMLCFPDMLMWPKCPSLSHL